MLDRLAPGLRCIAVADGTGPVIPALRRRLATVEIAVPPLRDREADALLPVAALVEDFARLFAGRWPSVTLDVDVAADMTVMLDRDQINQALWAVLQNAAEAAGTGSGTAQVTFHVRR